MGPKNGGVVLNKGMRAQRTSNNRSSWEGGKDGEINRRFVECESIKQKEGCRRGVGRLHYQFSINSRAGAISSLISPAREPGKHTWNSGVSRSAIVQFSGRRLPRAPTSMSNCSIHNRVACLARAAYPLSPSVAS